MKGLRIVVAILLFALLLFAPPYLVRGASVSYLDTLDVVKAPDFEGTLTIYHIASQKPYCGSLTNWLKARAAAYEKKHYGTHILIEGMGEDAYWERLEHGRTPDGYSFFSGTLYAELLKPLAVSCGTLREGLFATSLAVPYCYTGYCTLTREGKGTGVFGDAITLVRAGAQGTLTERDDAATLYVDWRTAGDLLRNSDLFMAATIAPLDGFTDQVAWLAVAKDADAAHAEALTAFYAYLLTDEVQVSLNTLGACAVLEAVTDVAPESRMKALMGAVRSVRTPDPLAWQRQADALKADAAAAWAGDGDAQARFWTRLQELLQ